MRSYSASSEVCSAALATLDLFPFGWMTADASGRVLYLNASAKRMSDRGWLNPRHPELRGLDINAAARDLGVARVTARNHLRSILQKTGAHRQSELVRLLMTAPP